MRSLVLAGAVLLAAGCGSQPKLVPVSGRVTRDGGPVTAGSLYLHPQPEPARPGEKYGGLLNVDGSFTARTFPYGDGVPPGSYKVTLSPELANRLKRPDHADPAKTPWELDVPDAGAKGVTFEVK